MRPRVGCARLETDIGSGGYGAIGRGRAHRACGELLDDILPLWTLVSHHGHDDSVLLRLPGLHVIMLAAGHDLHVRALDGTSVGTAAMRACEWQP